jgi:hypothetical protein
MVREHTDLINFDYAARLVKDGLCPLMESGQNITDCDSILFGQPSGQVWSVEPRPKHFDDSCMFSLSKDIWTSGDMEVLNNAVQQRQFVHICESRTSNG